MSDPTSTMLRCDLCGADPDEYDCYESGIVRCSSHPWCETCQQSHLRLPCSEQLNRIETTTAALRATAGVLADLDALDIRLPRVPVRLVGTVAGSRSAECYTRWYDDNGIRVARSAEIRIKSGLGPTAFGQAVAHEHTHALIHLRGAVPLDPELEEGVCELVTVVWLTNRRTDRETLWRIWHNPDPVYGVQLRRVVAVAQRFGVGVTLRSILTTGELP